MDLSDGKTFFLNEIRLKMFRTSLHNLGMASQEEGTGSATPMEINENGRSSNSVGRLQVVRNVLGEDRKEIEKSRAN